MFKIDYWYKDGRKAQKEIAFADCFFYPNSGHYAGNIYNKDGDIIGDYTSDNSIEIGKRFPGIFGE